MHAVSPHTVSADCLFIIRTIMVKGHRRAAVFILEDLDGYVPIQPGQCPCKSSYSQRLKADSLL